MNSANAITAATRRGWHPSPSRGSRVEPTVSELLAMAEGKRADWRPDEPSRRDLAAAEAATPALLAEFSALHRHVITTSEHKLRHTIWPSRRRALRHKIDESWDAIGHLGMGA